MSMGEDRARRLKALSGEIEQELDELASVVRVVDEALAKFCITEPTDLEKHGLGGLLHDFYTGLEKVFRAVAVQFDGGLPPYSDWHRQLLRQMGRSVAGERPELLNEATAERLNEYLRFRHVYRNVYGRHLDWRRLKPLLEGVDEAWTGARADIRRFTEFLMATAATILKD